MTRKTSVLGTLPLGLAVLLLAAAATRGDAATGTKVSRDGVTAYASDSPLADDLGAIEKAAWESLPPGKLPRDFSGSLLLVSKRVAIGLRPESDHAVLSVFTRGKDRLRLRGRTWIDCKKGRPRLRLLAEDKHAGLTVEVHAADGALQQGLSLSPDGILEMKWPERVDLTLLTRMNYAIVPSPVGTDLVYDARDYPGLKTFYLASVNMVVGLMDEGDCMMVGVWAPDTHGGPRQGASVFMEQTDDARRVFSSFSLYTAGQSFYLTYIEHPGIWHEEPLKAEYLEKDTAIAWQRPFDARWIGRFYIKSEQYHFPFYIAPKKFKLWGRCIRGWYYYPLWFDGPKTMVHFEKKFPPVGRLLIYYLNTHQGDAGALSPVGVMEKSLGKEATAKLMDFEGTRELVLLEHRNAVCAMTRKIEGHFAAGNEVKEQADVDRYADDVATFIRLIRERVFAYDRFARETGDYLAECKKRDPGALAGDLKGMEELLEDIRATVKADLPKASLEEVRKWTDAIKALATQVRPGNAAKVKALALLCRSVAGTQDDMARNLSILTIRLMEEASDFGLKQPDRAVLARQVIARCRAILRQPTWWEPCRKYMPKSDPGAP